MSELLTSAQMRAIETAAIESGEVTGLELMERAGRGVVEAVFEEWPKLAQSSHRAVVLCGPGNNGGDGFVVARLLKEWGWEVEVFLYGNPEKLPPDAKVNYERWRALGAVSGLDAFDPWDSSYSLGVDALFGTGLARAIDQKTAGYARNLRVVPHVVSVDIPSGYCSDSGRVLDPAGPSEPAGTNALEADLTVTFQYQKSGHFLGSCAIDSGTVRVVDIGLDHKRSMQLLGTPYDSKTRTKADYSAIVSLVGDDALRPGYSDPASFLDKGYAGHERHKYSHGHALILSGGAGKGGAGRLAARGALRIGAGLVTLGCPPGAPQENAAQLTAVMLKSLGSDEDLALLLQGDARINALCLGPGLGTGARERQMVAAALAASTSDKAARGPGSGPGRGLVLDADALTLIAGDAALFGALHAGCVLTPHAGEFARLFPDLAEKLAAPATKGPAYSKVDATREAAKRAGCTVLFKGPDTVIASPDGTCAINSAHYDRAAPWLATAGSGDVLAGFITGLLARGFNPQQAAETAAWLHVECALKFGPGLIAEDLPEMLPQVFRDLGL